MQNPAKSFHQFGIIIMALAALGMLANGYGLMSSLLYRLPWFGSLQSLPLEAEKLAGLMSKARFFFILQLLAHGLIFASAFLLMKMKMTGRWLLTGGAALVMVLALLLPLSFPAADVLDNPEAILAYKELRSQMVISNLLWAALWAVWVYYINLPKVREHLSDQS